MLEYEFETVNCMEDGGGYSLFGGSIETIGLVFERETEEKKA